MAKAQAVKPKFSFADLFRGKPKAAARPASHSGTQTRLPAGGGAATAPAQGAKAAADTAREKAARGSGGSLSGSVTSEIGLDEIARHGPRR